MRADELHVVLTPAPCGNLAPLAERIEPIASLNVRGSNWERRGTPFSEQHFDALEFRLGDSERACERMRDLAIAAGSIAASA